MDQFKKNLATPASWKTFLFDGVTFLATFYLATLCIAVFFIHRGQHWIIPAIILIVLYLFIVITSLKRMMEKLPMAAIILAAPTIPLFMLILVISLIPVLQLFK